MNIVIKLSPQLTTEVRQNVIPDHLKTILGSLELKKMYPERTVERLHSYFMVGNLPETQAIILADRLNNSQGVEISYTMPPIP